MKPAADAIREAGDREISEALGEAVSAAEKGLEATKEMVAQHGRIAYYQEQSKGKPDPGATVGVLIMKGFSQFE
jgi:dihydroxyacetone kinase-like protein